MDRRGRFKKHLEQIKFDVKHKGSKALFLALKFILWLLHLSYQMFRSWHWGSDSDKIQKPGGWWRGEIKGVSTWHFNIGTRFWIEWVYPSLIVGDWNLRTLERRWNDPGRVWGRAVVRGMCVFTIGQKESAWLGSEWRRSRRRHTVVCTFLCEVQCEVERQQN